MANITGRIFDLGKSALFAAQQGVNVAGHNISNVNTPGFTRQRLILETNAPVSGLAGQVGSGVRAAGVQRIHDRFIDNQINTEIQSLGRWEARKEILETAEIILEGPSGSGVGSALDAFWNAWQDLSNNPSGLTERALLLSTSETLSFRMEQAFNGLDELQRSIALRMQNGMMEVEELAAKIADLNGKIAEYELKGQNANDFRDRRGVALKSLSELIDVIIAEGDNGMVYVNAAKGRSLVVNATASRLDPDEIIDNVTEGRIAGWRDTKADILGYIADLQALSEGIITETNALHTAGFDLNGDPGIEFFTALTSGMPALNIDDPNLVAAAASAGGAPGDNANAVAVAELQNKLTMSGGLASFGEFYNAMVSGVGSDVYFAEQTLAHQTDMVTQLENFRESISGVSVDEEMINVIQFQNAFEAASKLITTADEMLETVMNMI